MCFSQAAAVHQYHLNSLWMVHLGGWTTLLAAQATTEMLWGFLPRAPRLLQLHSAELLCPERTSSSAVQDLNLLCLACSFLAALVGICACYHLRDEADPDSLVTALKDM